MLCRETSIVTGSTNRHSEAKERARMTGYRCALLHIVISRPGEGDQNPVRAVAMVIELEPDGAGIGAGIVGAGFRNTTPCNPIKKVRNC